MGPSAAASVLAEGRTPRVDRGRHDRDADPEHTPAYSLWMEHGPVATSSLDLSPEPCDDQLLS